jgi:hypothetical protein
MDSRQTILFVINLINTILNQYNLTLEYDIEIGKIIVFNDKGEFEFFE